MLSIGIAEDAKSYAAARKCAEIGQAVLCRLQMIADTAALVVSVSSIQASCREWAIIRVREGARTFHPTRWAPLGLLTGRPFTVDCGFAEGER